MKKCKSKKIKEKVDAAIEAKEKLDDLTQLVIEEESSHLAEFESRIDKYFSRIGIEDAEERAGSSNIKIEYIDEFNIDAIADAVSSSLTVAISSLGSSFTTLIKNEENVSMYTDIVSNVAEIAKSSSSLASSLSFSGNRISGGVYAFLYSVSTNVKLVNLFGSKTVNISSVFYKLYQSLEDLQNNEGFNSLKLMYDQLEKVKKGQTVLLEEFLEGKITMEVYTARDNNMELIYKKIKDRIESSEPSGIVESASLGTLPQEFKSILERAEVQLKKEPIIYKRFKEKMSKGYFN
ncbi:hypothetical protein [Chondrinema litorale]|uniref:hypothetical protein n=1 Tax=Chondrinema litorale TaxID=2994555 RepID=UPI002542FE9D|nr:hypothetical protein [Chondrinema litorale]UZS00228.1 hypothetical protein OQ292_40420 [Chondrinema litorale]